MGYVNPVCGGFPVGPDIMQPDFRNYPEGTVRHIRQVLGVRNGYDVFLGVMLFYFCLRLIIGIGKNTKAR